jgi:hypothetical protein
MVQQFHLQPAAVGVKVGSANPDKKSVAPWVAPGNMVSNPIAALVTVSDVTTATTLAAAAPTPTPIPQVARMS